MKRLSVIAILLLLGGVVWAEVLGLQPFTTVSNTLGSSQVAGTKHPLHVLMVDTSGDALSVGGGVQYTEGDTDATITGTALLWEDAANTLRAASAANPFPVNIISGAGSGGTAATDDSAFTLGTTNVTVAGCIAATDSMDAGDLAGMKCGVDRELDVDIVSFTIGGVEGTITDLANSNPLATMIVDAAGTQITSFGGGTQYAVDTALGATPTGTLAVAIRDDTLSTLTPVEGDAVGLRVTSTGALWAHVTGTGAFDVQITGGALTALALIDNIVSVEDAVAGSAFSGVGFLAVRQDSHSDLAADGDFIPVTVDADGGLRVSIVAGAGSGGTAQADDADFTDGTTSGTPIGGVAEAASPTTVTEGDFGWAAITLNRALKVTLYNSTGTEIVTGTDYTHNAALTADSTGGPASMRLAKDFDASALPNVVSAEGDAVIAAASLYGVQYVMVVNEDGSLERGTATTPYVVSNTDLMTGASGLKYTSAGATEDEHAVKASAGTLYSITVTNTNAAARYLRCENDTAANTTPGSETVELDLAIPGATTGAGFTTAFPQGFAFSTGLTCWVVTGAADTDVAEVAANEIKLFYTFK